MRSLIVIASTAALLLATACAKAHFVWVAIETNDHKAVAHLYFHESAAPSAPRLIKHIAQSKLWARSADGKVDHLEAKIVVRGDVASLAAPINTVSPYSVEADCLYGVYSVDDKPVLLHYYAKSFYENPGDFSALGRAKGLGLDIVPSITPAGLQLQVLRQGKPAVGSEIVVVSPSEKETSLKNRSNRRRSDQVARPRPLRDPSASDRECARQLPGQKIRGDLALLHATARHF